LYFQVLHPQILKEQFKSLQAISFPNHSLKVPNQQIFSQHLKSQKYLPFQDIPQYCNNYEGENIQSIFKVTLSIP